MCVFMCVCVRACLCVVRRQRGTHWELVFCVRLDGKNYTLRAISPVQNEKC